MLWFLIQDARWLHAFHIRDITFGDARRVIVCETIGAKYVITGKELVTSLSFFWLCARVSNVLARDIAV